MKSIEDLRANPGETRPGPEAPKADPLAVLTRDLGVAAEVERWRRKLLEPRNDCVLLGPAGCGKTSLLASLARACEVATADLELRLVPLGSLPGLIGDFARDLVGEAVLPHTTNAATHKLQLELRGQILAPHPGHHGIELEITIQDTPGSMLFEAVRDWASTTGTVAEILDEACSASWLVLCVDAVNPHPALWQAAVPQLVARLAAATRRLVPRGSSEQVAGVGDYPALMAQERKLPQQRVLVLLTKIDQVCAAALASLRSSREVNRDRRLRELADLGGEGLARRLDPFPMVQSALGGGALGMLRAALPRGAQIAVGITSALGFPPAQEGGVLNSAARARSLPGPEDPLRAWQPFGLRETLIFLATGQCLHPVTPIDAVSALTPTAGQVLELAGDGSAGPNGYQPQHSKGWNQET